MDKEPIRSSTNMVRKWDSHFTQSCGRQQCPTFSSPEMGFVEDSFSMNGIGGSFQDDWSTVGFMLLWESMATTKVREGRAQAVLEWWGTAINIDEASLSCPLSPPAVQLWCHTGHWLMVLSVVKGLETPVLEDNHTWEAGNQGDIFTEQTLQKIPELYSF